MNEKDFIVLDLETSGLNPEQHEILEVYAQAINCRTLKVMDEFYARLRLLNPSLADEGALRANGFTLAEALEGSEPKVIWPRFVQWVRSFNKGKNHNPATAPIVGGKNIAFDLGFINKYNQLYAGDKTERGLTLFARSPVFELENFLFLWFENDPELNSMSLDSCREYLGIPSNGAHRARKDVIDTVAILTRFLKLHRELCSRGNLKFKGAMKNERDKDSQKEMGP